MTTAGSALIAMRKRLRKKLVLLSLYILGGPMDEDERTRKQRYAMIADGCKECKAYRPRTKQQCKIYKLLLQDMSPDMVRNEKCFLEEGRSCKGFILK